MRQTLRRLVNGALRPVGVRVVGARWGPRGCWQALRRVRALGVLPRQIVDVGAWNGVWTEECLRVFPEASYFLVDPLPANRPALEALSRARPNVRIWQGALAAAPGSRTLYEHRDQSSLLKSDSFPALDRRDVEVRRLDSFLDDGTLDAVDFLKADVQGMELEVLAGAKRCLAAAQLLLLEVSFREIYTGSPLAHEVIAAAGDAGFRIYDICTYVQRPGDGELMQADVLFAPQASPLFRNEGYRRDA